MSQQGKAYRIPTVIDRLVKDSLDLQTINALIRNRDTPKTLATAFFSGGSAAGSTGGGTGDFLPVAGGTMVGNIAFEPKLIIATGGHVDLDPAGNPPENSSNILVTAVPAPQDIYFIDGAERDGQYLIYQGTNQQVQTLKNANLLPASFVGDGATNTITVTLSDTGTLANGSTINVVGTDNFDIQGATVASLVVDTSFTYDLGSVGSTVSEGGTVQDGNILSDDGNDVVLDGTLSLSGVPIITLKFDITAPALGAWRVVSGGIGGGAGTGTYLAAKMSADQPNVPVAAHIQFNTVIENDSIVLQGQAPTFDQTSGIIELKANTTYYFSAYLDMEFTNSTDTASLAWWDITNGAPISQQMESKPQNNATTNTSNLNITTIHTPSTDITVELRVIAATNPINPVFFAGSQINIFEFSGGSGGGNGGSTGTFISADLTADQTANFAVNDHVEFDRNAPPTGANGGIVLQTGAAQANGIFELKAGKTYFLTSAVNPQFSGNGSRELVWYDITNGTELGRRCLLDDLAQVLEQPKMEIIFTPGTDVDVEVRIVGASGTVLAFHQEFTFASIFEFSGSGGSGGSDLLSTLTIDIAKDWEEFAITNLGGLDLFATPSNVANAVTNASYMSFISDGAAARGQIGRSDFFGTSDGVTVNISGANNFIVSEDSTEKFKIDFSTDLLSTFELDYSIENTTRNPNLTLFREETGTIDDIIGNIFFKGQRVNSTDYIYSSITSTITDPTVGLESSSITLNTSSRANIGFNNLIVNAENEQKLRYTSVSNTSSYLLPIFELQAQRASVIAGQPDIGQINFNADTDDGGGIGAVESFAQIIAAQEDADIDDESGSLRFRVRDQSATAGALKTYLQFNDTNSEQIQALKNLDMNDNGIENISIAGFVDTGGVDHGSISGDSGADALRLAIPDGDKFIISEVLADIAQFWQAAGDVPELNMLSHRISDASSIDLADADTTDQAINRFSLGYNATSDYAIINIPNNNALHITEQGTTSPIARLTSIPFGTYVWDTISGITFTDGETEPAALGQLWRDGDDIYAWTSNGLKNLADIGTGSSGANQQLSNLSGTVAVNLDLDPGTDGVRDIGNDSFTWNDVYAEKYRVETGGVADTSANEILSDNDGMILNVDSLDDFTFTIGGTTKLQLNNSQVTMGTDVDIDMSGNDIFDVAILDFDQSQNFFPTGLTNIGYDLATSSLTYDSGGTGSLHRFAIGGELMATINRLGSNSGIIKADAIQADDYFYANSIGDPSSFFDGQIWYNTTTNLFQFRQNGSTVELGGGGGFPVTDAVFQVTDDVDVTKTWQVSLAGMTANDAALFSFSTTASRTYTFPDISSSVMMTGGTQTVSGAKTFTSDLLTNASGVNIGASGTAFVSLFLAGSVYFDEDTDHRITTDANEMYFNVPSGKGFEFRISNSQAIAILSDGTLDMSNEDIDNVGSSLIFDDGHSITTTNGTIDINAGPTTTDQIEFNAGGFQVAEMVHLTTGDLIEYLAISNNGWIRPFSTNIGIATGTTPTTNPGSLGTIEMPNVSSSAPTNAQLDGFFSTRRGSMGIIDSGGTVSIVVLSGNGSWYQFDHDSVI